MGVLNWFGRPAVDAQKLTAGSFTVDHHGNVLTTTFGSAYPQWLLDDTTREVLALFRGAREAQMPLTEIDLVFAGLHITAREMRGGAIIFISPKSAPPASPPAGNDQA